MIIMKAEGRTNGASSIYAKDTRSDGHFSQRTLTAEHAEFDGKTGTLHLFPPVDMKDTDNQSGHFDQDVFVGTKEGEESVRKQPISSAISIRIPSSLTRKTSPLTPTSLTLISRPTPTLPEKQ